MTTNKCILLVEDDVDLSAYISVYFESQHYDVLPAYTARQALDLIYTRDFDAVILDVKLPDGDGFSLFSSLKEKNASLPIVVSSSLGEVQSVVHALKLGASDYIQKPVNGAKLVEKIRSLLDMAQPQPHTNGVGTQFSYGLDDSNSSMSHIWRQINEVVHSDASIMIYGETGSGKTFLAKEIHERSHRNKLPFIHINCPSIPENLIEREMFGHEKGAFTGADSSTPGKLEHANGGTVFLDEIGDIPLPFQAKLLRVLDSREFERLGSNKTIEANVRFIAATNRDLDVAVKNGQFREDLFYRLNVFPIHLAPLRNRKDDIGPLANSYLNKLALQYDKTPMHLSHDAIKKLQAHDWPGNIRELENILQRAFHTTKENVIQQDAIDIRESVQKHAKTPPAISLKEIERQKLLDAIKHSGGSITRMANILGVGRDTVYRWLTKHGIDYKK